MGAQLPAQHRAGGSLGAFPRDHPEPVFGPGYAATAGGRGGRSFPAGLSAVAAASAVTGSPTTRCPETPEKRLVRPVPPDSNGAARLSRHRGRNGGRFADGRGLKIKAFRLLSGKLPIHQFRADFG